MTDEDADVVRVDLPSAGMPLDVQRLDLDDLLDIAARQTGLERETVEMLTMADVAAILDVAFDIDIPGMDEGDR
jgi:hypothetical protein